METLLLTEQEVCKRLKLGRSTIRRLWAEGLLHPVKIGRSLRFSPRDLERYVSELEEQQHGS